MAPRAKSVNRIPDGIPEEFQDDLALPRGGRRWFADVKVPGVPAALRKMVRQAVPRRPPRRNFAMWQMNFPAELPDGQRNPVCSLGECGDPSCPTYRPTRPEVRMAVERCILEKCKSHFKAGALKTYASVGCGLLGQDWIVLEQLREEGLLPRRAVFVELRTSRPVMTCEGSDYPNHVNLRQTGFCGDLGPEFAFSATLHFDQPKTPSLIFEFSNSGADAIFVEAGGPEKLGSLRFGARAGTQTHSFLVEDCWEVNERQAHSFLFTVSAVGMYNVFRDGELIGRSYGFPPTTCARKQLYVGHGHGSQHSLNAFRGRIQKIKVWDQEVDPMAIDMAYSHEVSQAHQTMAQWYKNEMDVYSFGSLASYAAACVQDPRFAADLLLKIDVHDELDGYDDFVCKALDSDGLALTLGGPGKSWRRSGDGWLPVDVKCAILDSAEEKVLVPWAFMGSFPGAQDREPFFAAAEPARAECFVSSRRESLQRRKPSMRYGRTGRRGRRGRGRRKDEKEEKSEGRWYTMTDELSDGLALTTGIEDLLDEVDLDVVGANVGLLSQLDALEEEEDEDLPGLVVFGNHAQL